MKTIQLRRYSVKPGARDDFLSWWLQTVPALRRDLGFTIEFAVMDDDSSEFLWAVSAPGSEKDFESIESDYLASPARTEAFVGIPSWIADVKVSFVQRIC